MDTEAVFNNIAERILKEIRKAQKSIFIAVAWFTNKNIFYELVKKATNGCSVSLIISNDEINDNSAIDFKQLMTSNSRVYKIGNGDTELMHNKFCIIDHSTVITGSYNWSYKAETNFENVIITTNDTTLAEQFILEFNNIRRQYYPDEARIEIEFPLNKIIKRLEILINYILLEDIEELKRESIKLQVFEFNTDLAEIISYLNGHEFSKAINKIQEFISKNQKLTVWTDPEIAALKLEIKNLENQLNAFDNEKIELEKILSEFQHRHTLEFGDIILEILRLRKLKFKSDSTKSADAENDERQYREQFDIEQERIVYDLNEIEKVELKKKFRKATVLCHPDKVCDEYKDAAEGIFIELKKAYDANDVKKVAEILVDLEKGNFFQSRSETVSTKELLQSAISTLRRKIKRLESEIITIKNSATFNTINNIVDWDEYFSCTKDKLKTELESLILEIEN